MSDDSKTINNEDIAADTRRPIEPNAKTTKPPADADARYDASKVPTIGKEQYQAGQEFARGGMGRILKAFDLRVGREVALKESLGAQGKMLARFYREAMVTARLQHPGIVPIYELGRWPDGQPFYSMRLVKGLPLEDIIKDSHTLNERIALLSTLLSACEAVAYAHSQKIVHRDLKPANILCGAFGETVVIDWGIAKDLKSAEPTDEEEPADPKAKSSASAPSLTMAGAVMGTPVYMPPEQAHGLAIDERADVYALGAILYEVLCGEPPYKGKNAQAILMDLIEGPPPPLAKKQEKLPPDLVAIVEKAMSRDAKDRYRNAGELANELRKFQTGQIVDAYRYSNWELVKRFVLRNLLAFIVGGIAAVILAVAIVYSYLEVSNARDVAVEQSIGRAKEAVQLAMQLARTSLETDPSQSLRYLKEAGRSPYFDSWEALRPIAADALSRGVPRLLEGPTSPLSGMALSPDQSMIAAAAEDGSLRVWSLPRGEPLATLAGDKPVEALSFSPDSKLLAVSHGDSVSLWAPSGVARRALTVGAKALALSFSPDGALLALSCEDGKVRLYDTASGEVKSTLDAEAYPLNRVVFSFDGKLLAASGEGPSLFVWETSGWTRLATPSTESTEGDLSGVSFSPKGDLLAAAQGKDAHLWQISWSEGAASLTHAPTLKGHEWPIYALSFSPDGALLATASEDRSIQLWKPNECATSSCQPELLGKHKGSVLWLSFSSDGRTLASASRDRTVRLWDMSTRKEAGVLRGHHGEVRTALFSQHDGVLLSLGDESSLFLWDLSQIATRSFIGHQDAIFSLDISSDGKTIVTAGKDKTLRLWDISCGEEGFVPYCDKSQKVIEAGAIVWDVFFSLDGKTLLAALSDGTIGIWSAESGERLGALEGHKGDTYALDLSSDGKLLASASADKTIRLWDLSKRTLLRTLEGHTDTVLDISFSMDQRFLASASQDGTMRLWEVSTGKEVSKIEGPSQDALSSVCFSPDGKRLALAGYSSKIQLFSFQDGILTPVAVLSQHQGEIERIAFSQDGVSLASASWDGTARIWSLTDPGFESRPLLSHGKDVTDVGFSPDARIFAFVSEDKQLHLAPNSLPTAKEELKAWMEGLKAKAR